MMKTGIAALGALSLFNVAAAQPSGHHRRHQQLHEKRDVVTQYDYSYVTTTGPNVVVFVDENNVPFSTSTEGAVPATSAVASSAATSVAAAPSAAAYTPEVKEKNAYVQASSATTLAQVYVPTTSAAATTSQAAAAPSSKAAAAPSSKAASSSSAPASGTPSGDGYAIVYSPYRDDHNCKQQSEVDADFAKINAWIEGNGDKWSLVRSYGADCNQVAMMQQAGKQYGIKIFAGIYNVEYHPETGDKAFNDEMASFLEQVNGDWSMIHTVSVGNEVVNKGSMTVDQITQRTKDVKKALQAANYQGPVVAVDTFIAMISNPGLCDASDYAAVNAHPFFDVNTSADKAGDWVLNQMQLVSSTCGGKDTWITETGWPTQGMTNGLAVPGFSQQKSALSSIKQSVTSNLIMFTAFNDMWKENTAATFDAEQHWGICN